MTDEWQPIETAPKDGTDVLLFLPEAEPPIRIGHYLNGQLIQDGEVVSSLQYWCSYDGAVRMRRKITPSHWMPLPPPPLW